MFYPNTTCFVLIQTAFLDTLTSVKPGIHDKQGGVGLKYIDYSDLSSKYLLLGRVIPGPEHRVRGPAGAAPRPRDLGGAWLPALPASHGVGQAAARCQPHHRRSRYKGTVW